MSPVTKTPVPPITPQLLTPQLLAALQYAQMGLPVLPLQTIRDGRCSCGKRDCHSPGKHPVGSLVPNGLKNATTDAATIREWWREMPDANVALLTGAESGFIVLDVDPRHGGFESLFALESKHDDSTFRSTRNAATGGGGVHFLFQHPGNGIKIKTKPGALGPGLDIKGDGGYIVVAPSVHISGHSYIWSSWGDLAPIPQWLLPLIIDEAHPQTQPRVAADADDYVAEGQRNSHLTSLAGTMRRRSMSADAMVAALREENQRRCNPPLPDDEVRRIVESVSRYEPAQDDERLTDVGNAKRLVKHCADRFRYAPQLGKGGAWLMWDGRRWVPDDVDLIVEQAKEIGAIIHEEAAAALRNGNVGSSQALGKWAIKSESESRINAMIALAQSDPGIVVKITNLNADPWLLNVENGTIDLRTGELRPHRKEDLITKIAPVRYDPEARSDVWDNLLRRALPNAKEQFYLQKVAGSAIAGVSKDRTFYFAHGDSNTSKTTFAEAFKRALGDYAATTPVETFLKKKGDPGIRNDLARLVGVRLAVGSEVPEGSQWDKTLIKLVTGNDTVASRFLFQEYFEYVPQFTILLTGNHKPEVPTADQAFWNRLRLIPFTQVLAPEQIDRDMLLKLSAPEVRAAILVWAVRGCLLWQADPRLVAPRTIQDRTDEYRAENDPLDRWIKERCVLNPAVSTPAGALWDSYQDHCRENDEEPLQRRSWALRLKERGFTKERQGHGGQWVWKGILVRSVQGF